MKKLGFKPNSIFYVESKLSSTLSVKGNTYLSESLSVGGVGMYSINI